MVKKKAQIHDSYEDIYKIILEGIKHISINRFSIRVKRLDLF